MTKYGMVCRSNRSETQEYACLPGPPAAASHETTMGLGMEVVDHYFI